VDSESPHRRGACEVGPGRRTVCWWTVVL